MLMNRADLGHSLKKSLKTTRSAGEILTRLGTRRLRISTW